MSTNMMFKAQKLRVSQKNLQQRVLHLKTLATFNKFLNYYQEEDYMGTGSCSRLTYHNIFQRGI